MISPHRSNRRADTATRPSCGATGDAPGLGDRSEDICEPLLAIADMAGDDWPSRARRALVRLRTKGDTDQEEVKIQLLYAIREILQEWIPHRIFSKDLLKELVSREDEPWAAFWQKDIDNGNINGPGAKLARLQRPFGIVSRAIREPGQPVAKG